MCYKYKPAFDPPADKNQRWRNKEIAWGEIEKEGWSKLKKVLYKIWVYLT